MTPIIRNKADRERVRRWLSQELADYRDTQQKMPESYWFGEINATLHAKAELCGPAPKPKPRKKRSKR